MDTSFLTENQEKHWKTTLFSADGAGQIYPYLTLCTKFNLKWIKDTMNLTEQKVQNSLEVIATGGAHTDTAWVPKNLRLLSPGTYGKTKHYCLKNNDEITLPNDTVLYAQMSTLLSHHQRN